MQHRALLGQRHHLNQSTCAWALLALAALGAAACEDKPKPPLPAAALSTTSAATLAATTASGDALVKPSTPRKNAYTLAQTPAVLQLERDIEIQRARAAAEPSDWIAFETIATKALDRAKLTGDYADYKTAEDALAAAFLRATPGSGPLWVKANLDFTLHRIAAAAKDLDAVEHVAVLPYAQKLGAMTMRARIAYFQGNYKESLKQLAAFKPADLTSSEYVAREEVLAHTGHVDEARKVLDTAIAAKGASVAFLELAYGLLELDMGRYPEAQAHYERALKGAPGYWLYEEHLAEIMAKRGEHEAARLRYLDLIARTENPEFMDALASVYDTEKEPQKAAELRARANALFEQRVAMFPEAAAGHALEHYFRADPKRTVALAETNRDARPYGDSWVWLAKAYLVTDRLADARKTVETVLATEWNTPKLHAVAALIFEKSGDTRAATERKKALAMNAKVFEE